MPQSPKTKHVGNRRSKQGHAGPPRFALTGSIVLAVAALCALLLSYADWKQLADTRAQQLEQTKQFAEIDRRVKVALQKKIDDAKKAEADAKATSDADNAARDARSANNPAGTPTGAACSTTSPASLTVVINKKHCYTPLEWAPGDLVALDGFLVRQEAATQLQAMIAAATAAGSGFGVSSAYRSYANQVVTYNNWVTVNGSQAAADTVSARPGYSEHQTGLAVDLKAGGCALECFGSTAQYQWLLKHASDYGFIERYPAGLSSITGYSPEAWHWRYIGPTAAKDMQAKGIQTLEQYLGVPGGDYAS